MQISLYLFGRDTGLSRNSLTTYLVREGFQSCCVNVVVRLLEIANIAEYKDIVTC